MATHLGEGGVFVLDEPTTGLHLADVEQLLGLLDRLVDGGQSVIVVEHHLAVMAHADWIIDLGPGAGHDGGQVIFEGTPSDLVTDGSTLTGEHLAAYVGYNNRRGNETLEFHLAVCLPALAPDAMLPALTGRCSSVRHERLPARPYDPNAMWDWWTLNMREALTLRPECNDGRRAGHG